MKIDHGTIRYKDGSHDAISVYGYIALLAPTAMIFMITRLFLPWWVSLFVAVFGYVGLAFLLVTIGAVIGAIL